jgi:dolichol kinase
MSAAARTGDGAEAARKLIHFGAVIWPISWAFGWISTTQMRLIAAALFVGAAAIELLRRSSPEVRARFVRLFGPLLRDHEHHRITGATWGAFSMLVVTIALPAAAAQSALWAAVAGDGSGAVVGRLWQRARGVTANEKSWAGSIAVLAATAIGVWWLVDASQLVSLGVGAAAAIAERPRGPIDDNLRVTFVAGLAAWGLGVG